MERQFRIISDGSCDLGPELAAEKEIEVVPFYVCFDGEEHKKEIVELNVRDFYARLVQHPGDFPYSAAPSPEDYAVLFEQAARENEAVVCICITEKFSCSVQSARIARDMTLDKYPEARIAVLDSTVNTVLQGLLTLEAAALRDAGVEFKEAVRRLEELKGTGRIFFTVGSLDYLRHGGRIGKLAGFLGSVLDLRPLITLREGEIHSSGAARGRSQSREKVLELARRYVEEMGWRPAEVRLVVGYGYNREEAIAFRDELLKRLGWVKEKIEAPLCQIGATIAVHTGPHPLGIGVLKKA